MNNLNLPLNKKQKGIITSLARRAYKELGVDAVLYRIEDWRHDEQEEILGRGRNSLTQARQSDYIPLYNHFAGYAGLPLKEDNTYSPSDIAYNKLEKEIQKQELSVPYVRSIAISKHWILQGYSDDMIMEAIKAKLTPQQVMQLCWTIKKRGSAKTKKIRKELGL